MSHSFQIFVCFSLFGGAGRRRGRHHLGAAIPRNTQRAPFRGLGSHIPHPHSQEDTRTHPAHSLESLRKAMCTFTAVEHSQQNIKQGKNSERMKWERGGRNKNLELIASAREPSPSCRLISTDLRSSNIHRNCSHSLQQYFTVSVIRGAQGSAYHV